MQPNGQSQSPKVAEFFRAVVEGLRHAHGILRALVNDNHPGIVGHRDTTDVLIEGPKVADGLEAIAQRLDAQEENENP